MIITDKFVYIHQPKTGGTFVTTVLKRVHRSQRGLAGKIADAIVRQGRPAGYLNILQHGKCREIPPVHQGKPIVAAIRNPFDRYVSQYNFAWWKSHPESFGDASAVLARYPHFPNLSFEEFVELANTLWIPVKNDHYDYAHAPGRQTWHFMDYFCRHPRETFAALDDASIAAQSYRSDIYPVTFLKTESLNADLHRFLLQNGYSEQHIHFILTEQKIHPKRGDKRKDAPWEKFFSTELRQLIRHKERVLFDLFPEFER